MNKYDYFFIAGCALWLIETAFFGWNSVAKSVPEEMFNSISFILILYGAIGSLVRSNAPKIIINSKESPNH